MCHAGAADPLSARASVEVALSSSSYPVRLKATSQPRVQTFRKGAESLVGPLLNPFHYCSSVKRLNVNYRKHFAIETAGHVVAVQSAGPFLDSRA